MVKFCCSYSSNNSSKSRNGLVLVLFLALAVPLWAQKYDVNDTVTEYPMKGTYYHNRFEGRKTASGEIFNQNLFTGAHWKIKLGTYVMVTNRNTGLQVIVKINDRCPRRGILDMSHRAATSIGIKGCQPVTVRILPPGYEDLCTAQDALFDSVSSQFASGSLALKKNEKKKVEKPVIGETDTKKRYNLVIGSTKSHGEAFEMVSKLPKKYQEKVTIDSITEEDYTVKLEINLSQNKAKELCRKLKHTFNQCSVTPVE